MKPVKFSTLRFGILAAIMGLNGQSLVAQEVSSWALLDDYCMDCHNAEDWAGGLAFDLLSHDALAQDADAWEAAVRRLRGRLMPPPGSPQPEQADIDQFVGWMESRLDEEAGGGPLAGHVPIHRLNRNEYALAVKDLVGVDIDPSEFLPRDIEVHGFDNIAAALTVSPSFLDQFIGAARAVARMAIGEPVPKLASTFYPSPEGGQVEFQDGMPLGSRGGMKFIHHFPADGEYRFNILDLDVGLYPRSIETRHTVVVLVGGREIFRGDLGGEADLATVDRGGVEGMAQVMSRFSDITAQVPAGAHPVVVTFIERARAESDSNVAGSGAFGGLRVPRVLDGIEVLGPYNPTGISPTPSRRKVFSCYPQQQSEERACAERITANLVQRAFRRPVGTEDLDLLMPFYEQGRATPGGFDAGIEQVLTAILASPEFLYRGVEPPADMAEGQRFHALNDLELATRLSFFLWSQGPDQSLLEKAQAGELSQPEVLKAELARMLNDPKARALVNNFAIKWLNLDELEEVEPTPALFPRFSDALRQDFSEEMRRFLASILLEDRPVTELLSAQHSYLNERLARHYGIDDVHGAQFRRVELADERRWGVLGKGAVLLRTSYGDRTSPVLRGAWVLEKLMGTPPAPPPPNVETDLSVPDGELPTTIRARLETHRANPGCNQCHGVIDPIGLAMENFDVTGAWRDHDFEADAPIDARTVMPNGNAIDGPVALRHELTARPGQFVQAMTEMLLMYAIGRELEYFDMPQVRAIVRQAEASDYRLSAIVAGIVDSDAFRYQALPEGEAGMQVAGQ